MLARRIFADGRTRAYAWGRSAAREDVAAAVEALIAMSGQFEQRRLARPAYQLARARRLRRHGRDGARRAARLARARGRAARLRRADPRRGRRRRRGSTSCARSSTTPTGSTPGREDELRAERERLRHVTELAEGAAAAAAALAPDDGEGGDRSRRARRSARSRRSSGSRRSWRPPARRSAPAELAAARDRVGPARVPRLARGRARPARGRSRRELERLADLQPPLPRADASPSCSSARRRRARELDALADGPRPGARGGRGARSRRRRRSTACTPSCARRARQRAPSRSPTAVAAELPASASARASSGSSCASATPARPAPTRSAFLIRPNAGLPFGPVAETASGGELSRVALAIAAVAGGETMVFDEIDAGIGGTTAHAVAETLRRLAERAQVITITHLPQIASRRRPALPRREGPGRPDAHAHRAARRRRAPRRARADARRRRLPRHARALSAYGR